MLFGLIGYPIKRSFSRPYFTDKFKQIGLGNSHEYRNFELKDISLFPDIIAAHPELRGLNVTIPHKQTVMQYLDEIDPAAEAIGAVNTILIDKGRTKGYNTDMIGFREDFAAFIDYQSSHVIALQQDGLLADNHIGPSAVVSPEHPFHKQIDQRALVLGTGGASLAICKALEQLGIRTTLVSRKAAPGQITYAQIDQNVMAVHRYLINCTPLGSVYAPEECPDVPYKWLAEKHFCYDLVYNPSETLFLRKSKAQGARIKNGIGMLHGQAEAAWAIWTRDGLD